MNPLFETLNRAERSAIVPTPHPDWTAPMLATLTDKGLSNATGYLSANWMANAPSHSAATTGCA